MATDNSMDRHIEEFRSKGGGSRQRIMRVLGDKLDRHGAAFHKEHLQFEDQAEGPQTVEIVQAGMCSFGHTIDDKVRVAGACEIGGEILCSTEGCKAECCCCGSAVCRKHSKTYGEKTYCRRHTWIHYWRKFWGVE